MQSWTIAALAVVWTAQAQTGSLTLKLPTVKSSVTVEGQQIAITAWGTASTAPPGILHVSATIDLGGLQENLTPVLAAQLNRSERCGERISVERASLAPETPAGVLTANVHYERFGCAKAFGKEVVKRLVGGNATVEVLLTPSVVDNHLSLAAQVRKIDADGSLGQVLHSGSFGDSIREKIAASIESAIQKSANLKSTLPAAIEEATAIETLSFNDGGDGRLWLTISAEAHLSAEQIKGLAAQFAH